MRVKLLQVREGAGASITAPENIVLLLQNEAKADRECLWVLHLDTQNKVIEKELVSMGTVNAAVVSPREVFKKAILNSAASIAIAHNHPGGRALPSPEDLELMKQLIIAGDILGIAVLDFLVLTPAGYFWSGNAETELFQLKFTFRRV